jgi:hypothetical protein
MPNPFSITAATDTISLDAPGRGSVTYTVSNVSGQLRRGRARPVAASPAQASWLSVEGDAERNFPPNGTHQYTVRVAVPPATPPGRFTFGLDMVSVENPDEEWSQGPQVGFVVAAPSQQVKKPFPWWILVVLAAVLVVGGLIAWLASRGGDDVPYVGVEEPSTEAPEAAAEPVAVETSLRIVNVTSPAINCKFDADCSMTVSDTTGLIGWDISTGKGILQSRTHPVGEPGTPAAGLYNYAYRIALDDVMSSSNPPCVTQLRFDFGPVAPIDYDDDGTPDHVYVVTAGGLGTVGPSSAVQSGDQITFTFDPPVCAGSSSTGIGASSFFFGLASSRPDRPVTAEVASTPGDGRQSVDARAPQW